MTGPSRRGVVAGSLTLAFALAGAAFSEARTEGLPADLKRNPDLDAWLRIGADGTVTLLVGKVELGQGVLTALAQLCADELDVAVSRITVLSGDTALVPNQGITAGSQSIADGGAAVRAAAAEVRALLLSLAATRLGAPIARLSVEDGRILGGGRHTTYWALLGGRRMERQAAGVPIRSYRQRRAIGRSEPRRDLPAKVSGQTAFVQDLRPPGMLHARIVRPPTPAASLLSVETAAVAATPGVVAVVRNGGVLAVVADREWTAIKAARALAAAVIWDAAPIPAADAIDWMKSRPAQVSVIREVARQGGAPVARTLQADYRRTYLMHGSIGPSCAVALFKDGELTIDTHSQSVFETAAAIAQLTGLAKDKVRLRHLSGAGCYGHNGADDAAAEAAVLALAVPGRPIRLQWMRDEEHAFEPYGSPMAQSLRATVDARGDVLDWSMDLWSGSHIARPILGPGAFLAGPRLDKPFPAPAAINAGPPAYAADRNALPGYGFPGQKITTHFIPEMPVRVSSLRSLGAHGNVFAIESFMDELALAAGADPVAYRLRHLPDPRGRDVLRRAAARFGWDRSHKSPGQGRGVGYARYKNYAAYCAVCVEVALDPVTGDARLVRAVVAADAGQTVNPDGLANQLEGGLLQSLSWGLKEAVRFEGGRVATRDWVSYPILRIAEAPAVGVEILDRPTAPSLGAGECVAGPATAALANAWADATGERVRALPLRPGAETRAPRRPATDR